MCTEGSKKWREVCLKGGNGRSTTTTSTTANHYSSSSSGNNSTTTTPNTTPVTNISFQVIVCSQFCVSWKLVLVFILFHTWKWAAKCVKSFLRGCNISLLKHGKPILTCGWGRLTDTPKHSAQCTMSNTAASVGFFIHLLNHILAWNG